MSNVRSPELSLSLFLLERRETPRTLKSDRESVFVVEVDSAEEPGRLAKRGEGFLHGIILLFHFTHTHSRSLPRGENPSVPVAS